MNFLNCTALFYTFVLIFSMSSVSFAKSKKLSQKVEVDLSYINFAKVKNNNEKNHFEFNLNYKNTYLFSNSFEFNTDVGVTAFTFPDFAVMAPEFSLKYKKNKSSTFILGRSKVEGLSYLDQDWFLGLQTAFLRIDPLYPVEQGRMGFSYTYKTDQVFADFYGSPISIPDQFPGFDVSPSGQVSSDNPWSHIPPEKVRLDNGSEFDLTYDVINDSIPELVLDYQFGGTLGIQTEYLKIVGMYSNRPAKQLDLNLEAKLQTGTESLVAITAEPVFLREHFYGLQAESKWSSAFAMKNGFYGLVLEEDSVSSKYQTTHPDYFFITTDLNLKIRNYTLSLKHLYTKERPNEKDDVVYINLSRFLYKNAFWLEIQNVWYEKIQSNIGGVYSYKEKVARFYIESSYKRNAKWTYWGRLSLIHNIEDLGSDGIAVESGLSSYALLDSVNLGVSYVF